MADTIIRGKHDKENPYFMMSRDSAQDRKLSYEARGLLAYLLSKPGLWIVKISDLQLDPKQGEGKAGRDKVYSILDELAAHRYVKKPTRYQEKSGKWQWTSYEVYESPFPEKPYTVEPDTEKPYTENTEIIQSIESLENTDSHKEQSKTDSPNGAAVKPNAFFDAISKAFGIPIEAGMIKQYASFLAGTATKGDWKTFRVEPEMNAEDVKLFGEWYKEKYPKLSMPTKPNTIQRYVYEWRASKSAVVIEKAPNGSPLTRLKYKGN
jgi:hypothetical protein